MDEDGVELLHDTVDGGVSYVDLLREDGLSQQVKNLALSLVMQTSSASETVYATPSDESLETGDETTIRLAEFEDVKTICEFRYAQSIEYRGLSAAEESYRLFCTETEAYVRRNLNTHVYFSLAEQAGEVIAMSGLEVADRMPSINSCGKAERGATVVACYTLPQHRGKGYMRQMLSTWSTLAPLLGIDVIFLESHNPSMQLLALDEGYDYVSEKYRFDLVSAGRATGAAPLETFASVSAPEHLPVG